jgi:hypothetical protein
MSASGANDSVLSYSEQMKRGEYEQGRKNWQTAAFSLSATSPLITVHFIITYNARLVTIATSAAAFWCTLSLKLVQKQGKIKQTQKDRDKPLTNSWRRDLVEFSNR